MILNHPDRLFPSDTFTRGLARELYENTEELPIILTHGHWDPIWFLENKRFPDMPNIPVDFEMAENS